MSSRRLLVVGVGCLLAATVAFAGCGDQTDADPGDGSSGTTSGEGGAEASGDTGPPVPAKGPSHGSAIALSPDESRLVVANRDVGTVTVFGVGYAAATSPTMDKLVEIDVGARSEPWQVAISPKGDRAFVTLRARQKLVRIDALDKTPVKGPEVDVGSEPMGLALTPMGARAWVANWVDGTLSGVDTATMRVEKTIDLNATIAPLLGSALAPRPALAHPHTLAITNDGDDDDTDETLYATEFYAVRTEPEAGAGTNADTSRRGIVYAVKLSNDAVQRIQLAPMTDMGFAPTPGKVAGCYPNALQSITLAGKYAYVLSVCASPKGPLGVQTPNPALPCNAMNGNADCAALADGVCQSGSCIEVGPVKTTTAPLLSVIDTSTDPPREVASARTNLNRRLVDTYVASNYADDASRRLPLFPTDLAFAPGAQTAYVAANGSDAVFRLSFDAAGSLTEVGAAGRPFIDLRPPTILTDRQGYLPVGVAVGSKGFAFSTNEGTRNVSVLDLALQTLAGLPTAPLTPDTSARPPLGTTEDNVLRGRRFFNTGLGRWSLRGQGWVACQSCHPFGLSDGVTWYSARGPRQSTSLDGTYTKTGGTQRIFNWSATAEDIADYEDIVRFTGGGVGAIVSAASSPPRVSDRIDVATLVAGQRHDGLNGSARFAANPADPFGVGPGAASVLFDWFEIELYIKTVRPPRAARAVDPKKVAAGRALFEAASCQGCHGGILWTISELFYNRTAAGSYALTQGLLSGTWNEATFPAAVSPTSATTGTMRMNANTPNDSLTCQLREVGTFGVAEPEVAAGSQFEVRADMTTLAQGGDVALGRGYNPPSLMGVSVGAPYLHAGNARTLEALFSDKFAPHHRALASTFLTGSDAAARREELIHFLLTIDDDTATIDVPATGPAGGVLCKAN